MIEPAYYYFKYPYMALIKASATDDAISLYEHAIADIEDDFPGGEDPGGYRKRQYKVKASGCKMIQEKYALAMYHEADGKNRSVFETDEILESTPDDTLLLADASLL